MHSAVNSIKVRIFSSSVTKSTVLETMDVGNKYQLNEQMQVKVSDLGSGAKSLWLE